MEYANADLTALQQRKYNVARIIDFLLSTIGIILILVYFDNLSIVISCFLVIIAAGACFTWVQLKYGQYKDLKLMLSFFLFSMVPAAILWLMFLL